MSFALTEAHEENPWNLRGLLPTNVNQRQMHSEKNSAPKLKTNILQDKHLVCCLTELRWIVEDIVFLDFVGFIYLYNRVSWGSFGTLTSFYNCGFGVAHEFERHIQV